MTDTDSTTLEIGTRAFYPAHGVVSVIGLEERSFGEGKQSFYVLGLERGQKVLLPVGNVVKAGVRPLVEPAKARELLAQLAVPYTLSSAPPTSWKARAMAYADGLRSGCPDRYTEILRELLARSRDSKLSSRDKDALRVARGYFVAEIGAALELPADEIEAALEQPAAGA